MEIPFIANAFQDHVAALFIFNKLPINLRNTLDYNIFSREVSFGYLLKLRPPDHVDFFDLQANIFRYNNII